MMTVFEKLLISIVRRGRGDRVVALAKQAGARGSTVLLGRGTARNTVLRYLGLADTEKELVFTIASNAEMPPIIEALKTAPDLCKKVPGIAFTLNVSAFLRSGANFRNISPDLDEPNLDEQVDKFMPEYELICVIANYGFADEIMQAAREAGARGGTIIKARGTGTEKDSSFFGITIVPEKEMLMVLVKKTESAKILDAVRVCPCLAEPGIGIVFCMPVEKFFPLGLKANA